MARWPDHPITRSKMTEKILTVLFVFINSVVVATGYAGIALLMAIESACIPLPSELIMPFAGYLVYAGAMKLVWAATAGAIGCNLGSLVAYEIGCYGGRPLVVRYGRWILMGHRELDWADRFFLRWGDMAVFIARLLPVIRTFIALPAGIARMPRGKFHIYTFLGSWPWCFALAYFGMKLGENWRSSTLSGGGPIPTGFSSSCFSVRWARLSIFSSRRCLTLDCWANPSKFFRAADALANWKLRFATIRRRETTKNSATFTWMTASSSWREERSTKPSPPAPIRR